MFLLIFSTAFVPSQRCAVALTPNAPHCPHQGSATTEPPFKIYLLCFQSSVDHFSAAFTALSRLTSLLLIGPDDTSLPFQFASSWRSRCSPFSSFCSHEAWPRDVTEVVFVLSSIAAPHISPGPEAITPYMFTIWPPETRTHFGLKTREENLSNTWAVVLITSVCLLKADKFKIKKNILAQYSALN